MRLRRSTAEHPFGTLKAWMGSTHFLTKTLERVSTEMSLHVLAYNLKRVINLIGVESLIEAIRELLLHYSRDCVSHIPRVKMCIAQCHLDVAVTQEFPDYIEIDTFLNEPTSEIMSQIVPSKIC